MRGVRLADLEWGIIIPILVLMALSLVVIGEVHGLQRMATQAGWISLSIIAALGVLAVDHSALARRSVWIYGLSVLSLVAVLFTPPINGARSWFVVSGMSLQPSEFMKPALILFLAAYLPYREFYRSFPGLIPPLLFTLLPMGLIVTQPDLGTAILFIPIFIVVTLVAGVKVKHLLLLAGLAIIILPLMYPLLADHQKARLHAFIQPQKYRKSVNLHLEQAKTAIGAGGFAGYNPEDDEGLPHQVFRTYAATDYAFAVVGEKFGFLGTSFVLALFIWLNLTLYNLLLRVRDPVSRLVTAGVMAVFSAQAITHIGGNLDLIPFTGVPLPFVSSGGSSVMAFSISFALVLNVGIRRKLVFGDEREGESER